MYDAIIVGARCAGSPLAMLLAQRGHRVLVVDRATFPSDTISTHILLPPAIHRLEKWGLRGGIEKNGAPALDVITVDVGPFILTGARGATRPCRTPRGAPGSAEHINRLLGVLAAPVPLTDFMAPENLERILSRS